jgi:hypothetical protein
MLSAVEARDQLWSLFCSPWPGLRLPPHVAERRACVLCAVLPFGPGALSTVRALFDGVKDRDDVLLRRLGALLCKKLLPSLPVARLRALDESQARSVFRERSDGLPPELAAANCAGIVEHLLVRTADQSYLSALYAWTTPAHLLSELYALWSAATTEQDRIRVVALVFRWHARFPEDFSPSMRQIASTLKIQDRARVTIEPPVTQRVRWAWGSSTITAHNAIYCWLIIGWCSPFRGACFALTSSTL